MKQIVNDRPIVFIAFFFMVGVALSYYAGFGGLAAVIPCAAFASAFVLITIKRKNAYLLLLYAAVLCLAAFLFSFQYYTDFSGINPGSAYTINGRVSDLRYGPYNRYTLSGVTLSGEGEEEMSFSKKVYLYSRERLDYGDIVEFNSEVSVPSSARNPGAMDENMYLAAAGVGFTCFTEEMWVVGHEDGLYGFPLFLRESIAEKIDEYYTPRTAPIAKAMFLGINNELADEVRDEFNVTGTAHVLSISGLYVMLIVMAFLWLLKKMKVSRSMRFAICIIVLFAYLFVTGFALSIMRAVIMSTLVLLARWTFRTRDAITFLAVALLITLVLNTAQLFLPGFLFSYGVVFGFLCLMPAIWRFFERVKFKNTFSDMLGVSCVASAASAPLTAYYFRSISAAAPIANFYAVPLTMVSVVFTGLFAIFSSIPPLAAALALIPQLAIELMLQLTSLFASTNFAFITIYNFPVWACVAVFAAIYICSDYVFIRNKFKALISSALIGAVVAVMTAAYLIRKGNPLEIRILDVGTGDAIHLMTKGGDYLIENGGNAQRSQLEDYTKNNRISYELVIVSNDRTNSLGPLIESGAIKTLLVPNNYVPKDYDTKESMREYGLYDKIELSDKVVLEAVATDGKNYSFEVRCNSRAVCLLAQNEADCFEGYDALVPVIKLAKGGSAGSLSDEMLERINADVAVISVKGVNKYNLPDEQVMEALENDGAKIYETSERGAVTLVWNKNGELSVETMK